MANEITTQLNKVQAPQVAVIRNVDAQATESLASKPAEVDVNKLLRTEGQVASDSGQESAAEKLRDKVSQLNDQMQNLNRSLQFTVDEKSGDSVVTVRDAETDEIIRQFPSEELLKARNAVDNIKGILIQVDA
jgi:flagellar protein FlaG